jgi:hypothetical protein
MNERAADDTAQIGSFQNHTSQEGSDYKGRNDTLNSEIARRILDGNGFERLGRYEIALWWQVYQVIFVLNVAKPRPELAPPDHR